METVGWNAVLPQAPICCLGPRQLKETSHSPVLTGPHTTAQGKMEMPAPCLKSVGFQDRESRELNEARRPAHLHRPPATTPPRLGDPAPCLLGPGQPSESPSASTAPRGPDCLPLCGWGLPDLSSPDPIRPHRPLPHASLRDLTRHALRHGSPSISRLFQIILPPSPGLFSWPKLHSIRACCPSALQLAAGLGPWTPLMLVFGFAFRTSGRNPPRAPEGVSSEGRPH